VQVKQDSKAAADGALTIIRSMVFSPDGAYLAAGGDDKMLYLYKTDDWHMIHALYVSCNVMSILCVSLMFRFTSVQSLKEED
jgi:WD40 repeat protein